MREWVNSAGSWAIYLQVVYRVLDPGGVPQIKSITQCVYFPVLGLISIDEVGTDFQPKK